MCCALAGAEAKLPRVRLEHLFDAEYRYTDGPEVVIAPGLPPETATPHLRRLLMTVRFEVKAEGWSWLRSTIAAEEGAIDTATKIFRTRAFAIVNEHTGF
jgi:hypothetical protein